MIPIFRDQKHLVFFFFQNVSNRDHQSSEVLGFTIPSLLISQSSRLMDFFRRRFINHKNKSTKTIQLFTGGRGMT